MGLAKLKTKISVEDYLESEKLSHVRREYLFGEIYPIADSNDNHNRVVGNLITYLSIHLRDSSYETFFRNIKVRANPNICYYPDVLVSCEENPENPYFRNQPVLIVEVLSPSTQEIDRREKLLFYQQMSSVQEYVVVEQQKMLVEIHRRRPDGRWITYYFTHEDADENVEFQSVELTIPLGEIYRRVKFDNKISQ